MMKVMTTNNLSGVLKSGNTMVRRA